MFVHDFYFKIPKTLRPAYQPSNCSWLTENINSTNAISQMVTLATCRRRHTDQASPFFCHLQIHSLQTICWSLWWNSCTFQGLGHKCHFPMAFQAWKKACQCESESISSWMPTNISYLPSFLTPNPGCLFTSTDQAFRNKEFSEFINFLITGEQIKFSSSLSSAVQELTG